MTKRKRENPIAKTTKGKGANYRSTKSGAGMTKKGVAAYRKANPGSKLKQAGTTKFDNSLPEGHPFKRKRRTTGRYANHPIGKLLD